LIKRDDLLEHDSMRGHRGLAGAIAVVVLIAAVWSFSTSVFAAQLSHEPARSATAPAASEGGASTAATGGQERFPISTVDLALALGGGVLFVGTGALLVIVLPWASAHRRSRRSRLATAASGRATSETQSAPIGIS
jgi:hypothetical protein